MADHGDEALVVDVGMAKPMHKPGGGNAYAGIARRLQRALEQGSDDAVASVLKRVVQDCMDEESGEGDTGDRKSEPGEY